ncbi:peptidoglycan-binding protein [Streptomyces sp. R21]|uniref:Peptidoglycan-binding protein n=1 Tax=Streptomyces sp. R21 TaxID=3238627 RepID=A0AB39PIJ3_9ACTN
MTDVKGLVCPECGAPRAPDGTPSCACTQRASDALRDARTAEAAAAEDFDPLRIRPYVELEPGDADDSAATMRLAAVPDGVGVGVGDVGLFREAAAVEGEPSVRAEPAAPRRRRRAVLLGAAGAVVTVVAAAGFASGVFSYDTPARDRALPDDTRASVPDVPSEAASESASGAESSTASAPVANPAPSRSASASPSPSPSASPSESSAAPTATAPSGTATPSGAPTTVSATGSVIPTENTSDQRRTQSLRRGDRGPEVTELQLRLSQLSLFIGDPNGNYNATVEDAVRRYQWARGITADELGVYGGTTRARLESETREP